jgi:hypothetical protein
VLAGVHVQHDGAGPTAGRGEELGEEHVVDAIALRFADRGFEAGKGGLAGEVGAGAGSTTHGELESGIVAESGGVVGVFVAGGELVDALAEQVEEGVLDAGWTPGIVEAGFDLLGEAKAAVELGEEEETAVGGKGTAGEIDVDRFAREQRKVEHRPRIRHRRMFPFCA